MDFYLSSILLYLEAKGRKSLVSFSYYHRLLGGLMWWVHRNFSEEEWVLGGET